MRYEKHHMTLSPHHPVTDYAAAFKTKKRIHIDDLLDGPSAEWLYRAVSQSQDWSTVFNSEKGVHDLTPEVKKTLSAEQKVMLIQSVNNVAATRYQFFYDTQRISSHGELYARAHHPFAELSRFLNSDEFLGLMRSVTGHPAIALADAQVTRFGTGQFLHAHDDLDTDKSRISAYVISLVPEWAAEWGGILNFVGEDGNIAEGFVPKFNSINIFDVGASHFVSCIAPFAGAQRFSVTGWLRGR